MSEFLEAIAAAWAATSQLEIVSVVFGLLYVILAARENIWCWPCAFIGTGTAIFLFWDASLLMESGLNIYYLLMAIFGWWQWQYGSKEKTVLAISSWGFNQHALTIGLIGLLTLGSGYFLTSNTQAAFPYIDSFTTWAAVITTWMVARKILENWLYWIVINPIGVWLFSQRGLYLYAMLFILYTIISIFGYLTWRRNYQKSRSAAT
ncbi:MAG: nicotinamide riboside transporter PnuC [Acidiferrobacterales bacterium]|nr:nicotinamide riboside transporter PnuC [Acidiferrobacterales bacterium]